MNKKLFRISMFHKSFTNVPQMFHNVPPEEEVELLSMANTRNLRPVHYSACHAGKREKLYLKLDF